MTGALLAATDPIAVVGAVTGALGAILAGWSKLQSARTGDRTMAREELEAALDELRQDNTEVRSEVRELRRENRELHDEVGQLREAVARCEGEKNQLAREVAALRGDVT